MHGAGDARLEGMEERGPFGHGITCATPRLPSGPVPHELQSAAEAMDGGQHWGGGAAVEGSGGHRGELSAGWQWGGVAVKTEGQWGVAIKTEGQWPEVGTGAGTGGKGGSLMAVVPAVNGVDGQAHPESHAGPMQAHAGPALPLARPSSSMQSGLSGGVKMEEPEGDLTTAHDACQVCIDSRYEGQLRAQP